MAEYSKEGGLKANDWLLGGALVAAYLVYKDIAGLGERAGEEVGKATEGTRMWLRDVGHAFSEFGQYIDLTSNEEGGIRQDLSEVGKAIDLTNRAKYNWLLGDDSDELTEGGARILNEIIDQQNVVRILTGEPLLPHVGVDQPDVYSGTFAGTPDTWASKLFNW